MTSLNKVVLIGNVGQDPEIRMLNNSREIANFSLATTENWKDKSTGERKERTEWHKIVVFNQFLLELIKTRVKKGTLLYVEGKLQKREFEGKSYTEIVIENYAGAIIVLSRELNKNVCDIPESDDDISDEIPF